MKPSSIIASSSSYHIPASNYDPLLQTVSFLITKISPTELSPTDQSLLLCSEFYEKAFREGLDLRCINSMIEQFAVENEKFSMMLTIIILKGLHKVMFDEVKPLAEAFTSLLNIKDSLQMKRIQWLLGYPQPEIICSANSFDNFGIYGLNNLDDNMITYNSTLVLDGAMSVLEVMVHNINRVESVCLVCLKHILLLSQCNPLIFDYIASLPSHCYLYAKFIDWVKPFLDKYKLDLERNYFGDARKKELYIETENLYVFFMNKFNEKYPDSIPEQITSNEQEENYMFLKPSILDKPLYIIGQTMNEISSEIQRTEDFVLLCKEVSAMTLKSMPTGKTNLALPRNIARDTYLFPSSVDSNSVYSCFVHSKYTYTESYAKKNNKIAHFYQFFKSKLALNFCPAVNEKANNLKKNLEDKTITRSSLKGFQKNIMDLENNSNNMNKELNNDNNGLSKQDLEKESKNTKKYDENDSKKEESDPEREFSTNNLEKSLNTKENLTEETSNKTFEKEEKNVSPSKELLELSDKVRIFECIRKYTFENKSNRHILITLLIRPVATSENSSLSNILPMQDPVIMLARPYAPLDVLFLMKINFEKDWDQYEVIFKHYTIFTLDNVVKEMRVFISYAENKNKECDSLVLEDENPRKTEIQTKTLMKMGSSGKRKVGFIDQEFELFPEDVEFMEALDEDKHMRMDYPQN